MKMKKMLLTCVCLFGIQGMVIAQDEAVQAEQSAEENSVVAPAGQIAPEQVVEEKVNTLEGKLTGMEESYLETKATVDKLKKIKISGYIQAQYRTTLDADTLAMKDTTAANGIGDKNGKYSNAYKYPVGDFAGGAFGGGLNDVLQLRRARIKVAYETEFTAAVVQFDCLPFTTRNAASGVTSVTTYDTTKKYTTTNTIASAAYLSGGGVTIKDAYLRFADRWAKTGLALKAGVYDRPFGFEIGYSSSSRETPERSRVFQTLFPGERDLGLSLEYLPTDNLPPIAQMFNVKVGSFAGNGINVETDNNRDIIGRLGFAIPLTDINLAIDGGFSGYAGAVKSPNDSVFKMVNKKFALESTGNKYKAIDRQYVGGDIQLYYDVPVIGGFSLRGEYISIVNQPGAVDNAGSPRSDIAISKQVYNREGMGYYLNYIQNLDPIKSQFVLKYDLYDPNTAVAGDDINLASKLKSTEIAYSTLGLGAIYHWDENVKIVAYLDMVTSEKVNADYVHDKDMKWYTKDLTDNVFTLRVQYKF